ncbi:hypothetical protein C8F01DRAFT_1301059 [Mycena amicta]|nr:hypothetical protein C8F01DRAFT_1301059 [Mycena amicta]
MSITTSRTKHGCGTGYGQRASAEGEAWWLLSSSSAESIPRQSSPSCAQFETAPTRPAAEDHAPAPCPETDLAPARVPDSEPAVHGYALQTVLTRPPDDHAPTPCPETDLAPAQGPARNAVDSMALETVLGLGKPTSVCGTAGELELDVGVVGVGVGVESAMGKPDEMQEEAAAAGDLAAERERERKVNGEMMMLLGHSSMEVGRKTKMGTEDPRGADPAAMERIENVEATAVAGDANPAVMETRENVEAATAVAGDADPTTTERIEAGVEVEVEGTRADREVTPELSQVRANCLSGTWRPSASDFASGVHSLSAPPAPSRWQIERPKARPLRLA